MRVLESIRTASAVLFVIALFTQAGPIGFMLSVATVLLILLVDELLHDPGGRHVPVWMVKVDMGTQSIVMSAGAYALLFAPLA